MLERHAAVADTALKTIENPTEPAQVAAVPEPRDDSDIARRIVPPSTAGRTASGIAATPGRAVGSNGSVEGHVNRLKTIKRQMYGRAGFVLLQARVLNAAWWRGATMTPPELARPTLSKVREDPIPGEVNGRRLTTPRRSCIFVLIQ